MAFRICVFLAVAIAGVLSNPCAAPNDACDCTTPGTMICSKPANFPTSLPSTVTLLMLDSCADGMLRENTLPADLQYPDLEGLHVINCQIQMIGSGAFMNMPKLKMLDLSRNELTIVNKVDFMHLANLEDLNIADNGLIELKADLFENIPGLISLNLNGNQISTMSPNTFEPVKGTLSKLYIEKMDLQEMPTDVISLLTELTVLELNDNSIKSIPDGTFDNNDKLTRLDMNQCKLGNIGFTGDTFRNLNNLEFLNLGFNEINEIPLGTFDPFKSSLRSLYIEHNQLTTLDSRLVDWEKVSTLNISSNPWNCDCGIKWMSGLDLSINGFATNVVCADPPEVTGQSLHNVTLGLEECSGSNRSSVIALAITIPIIIICAGFIGYYLYKIIMARRQRGQRKSVRYSEVYRDTVESTNKPPRPPRPVSEL